MRLGLERRDHVVDPYISLYLPRYLPYISLYLALASSAVIMSSTASCSAASCSTWGDIGRCGEIEGDITRCREM